MLLFHLQEYAVRQLTRLYLFTGLKNILKKPLEKFDQESVLGHFELFYKLKHLFQSQALQHKKLFISILN